MNTKLLALLVCGLAASPWTWAQNAIGDGRRIGDGRVLDQSFNARGGRQNDARVSFGDELRFRNSIVTGNAPGGISFRGDVGYRAPGDLSISVGSDTTFAFRRDSFYSGLGGQGIRGTDALQYQFAATSGMRPPASFNRFDLSRNDVSVLSAEGSPVYNAPSNTPTRQAWNSANIEPDDTRGQALSLLRSPSAYNTARSLQPALMGVTRDQSGERFGMVASPTRGLSMEPLDGTPKADKEVPGPQAVQRAGLTAVPGSEPKSTETQSGPVRRDNRPTTGEALPIEEQDDKPTFETAFDQAMRRLQTGETEGPTLLQRMDELRQKLEKDTRELQGRRDREEQERIDAEKRAAERGRGEPGVDDKGRDDNRKEDESKESTLPTGSVGALRSLKVDISTFAPKGFDAYSEHMAAGQKLLEQGRYFDAEERFTAALSVKPGDTTAALARVNAALGASLFRSAGLNLRTLILDQPEVAAVRFGSQTLPPPPRLARIKESLRETLREGGPRARDIGLLLAYTGLHTADASAIKEGLDALGAPVQAGDDPATARLVRLAELLRQVWVVELKEREPSGVESPTPKPEGGR